MTADIPAFSVPLMFLSICTGIIPFSYFIRWKPQKLQFCYTWICPIVLIISHIVYFIVRCLQSPFKSIYDISKKLLAFIMICTCFAGIFANVYFYENKYMSVLNGISKEQHRLRFEGCNHDSKTTDILLFLLVLWISFDIAVHTYQNEILMHLIWYYTNLTIFMTAIHFIYWVLYFYREFCHLNAKICALVSDKSKNDAPANYNYYLVDGCVTSPNVYTNNVKTELKSSASFRCHLAKLELLHIKYTKICEEMCNSYGSYNALLVIRSIVEIPVQSLSIFAQIFGSSDTPYETSIVLDVSALLRSISVFIAVCICCQRVTSEANDSVALVYQALASRPGERQSRHTYTSGSGVRSFVQPMMQCRHSAMSAYGIFTIDASLLSWVATNIITFTIALIQFASSENNVYGDNCFANLTMKHQ